MKAKHPNKFWSFAKNQTKTRENVVNVYSEEADPDILTTTDAEKAGVLQCQFTSVFTQEPEGEIRTISGGHGL